MSASAAATDEICLILKNKSTGLQIECKVPRDATIQTVREKLAPLIKRKLHSILLFEGEDYLQNEVTLAQYDIAEGATLLYEARLCGILPINYDWSQSGLQTKRFKL